jgi:NADH:ubiquinone oxidoreductase subunit 4 (subunit M)
VSLCFCAPLQSGTSSFVGEFLILAGSFKEHNYYLLGATSVVIGELILFII